MLELYILDLFSFRSYAVELSGSCVKDVQFVEFDDPVCRKKILQAGPPRICILQAGPYSCETKTFLNISWIQRLTNSGSCAIYLYCFNCSDKIYILNQIFTINSRRLFWDTNARIQFPSFSELQLFGLWVTISVEFLFHFHIRPCDICNCKTFLMRCMFTLAISKS